MQHTKTNPSALLPFPENYGEYAMIANGEQKCINTLELTLNNWQSHYDSVLNILKDAIETNYVQSYKIDVTFADGIVIGLCTIDYYINLAMWYALIRTKTPIEGKHIFFDTNVKKNSIKDWIDCFIIDPNRRIYSNTELNNIIDDTLYKFHDIDLFSMYLANTVNLEDSITLMNLDPEFYECLHADLSAIPIEDTKNVGMAYTNKSIDIIVDRSKNLMGYDHCLADAWRSSEGINPKQYKEVAVNIGPKPDGQGGVFPAIINKSFINGGVSDPLSYVIDSSGGRTAQIIKYNNVGTSGHFARILGLNNLDTFMHPDSNYDCNSKNYLKICIRDATTLKRYNNRYYRFTPNGMQYLLKFRTDQHLIGKTLLFRSPSTCASKSRGHGICYKCYGDLAYTVFDVHENFGINIGRIASEILSAKLTSKLLSAKHLIEAAIKKLNWVKEFFDYFYLEYNVIMISEDIDNLKPLKLIIDPDDIELQNEEDDDLGVGDDSEDGSLIPYNEYITRPEVQDLTLKKTVLVTSEGGQSLYITNELNRIIRRKAVPLNGMITIDFADLKGIPLFVVPIDNNEISATLEHLENLLNKSSTIKDMDMNELVQEVLDTSVKSDLDVNSVHLETIISNQIRDYSDILDTVDWSSPHPQYQLLSLNTALNANPSVLISLSYQKITRMFYNPLTFRKRGASFMDFFFMEKPQLTIYDVEEPDQLVVKPGELIDPVIFHDDPFKVTTPIIEEIDDIDIEPTLLKKRETKEADTIDDDNEILI